MGAKGLAWFFSSGLAKVPAAYLTSPSAPVPGRNVPGGTGTQPGPARRECGTLMRLPGGEVT